MFKKFAVASFAISIFFSPGGVQSQDVNVIDILKSNAATTPELEETLDRLLNASEDLRLALFSDGFARFKRIAEDGYVDRRIIDRNVEADLARARAKTFQNFHSWDLNADLHVSADEIERISANLLAGLTENATSAGRFMRQVAEFDGNSDGQVSIDEATAHAQDEAAQRVSETRLRDYDYFMLFDLNRDGRTTTEEYSKAEIELRKELGASPDSIASRLCPVPKATAESVLLVFEVSGGSGISTVALGEENEATEVSTVEILPGETPIYFVASRLGNTIVNFTGATERLEAVVLQGGGGAVGVDKARVTLVGFEGCFRSRLGNDADRISALTQIEANFGKSPLVLKAAHQPVSIDAQGNPGPPESARDRATRDRARMIRDENALSEFIDEFVKQGGIDPEKIVADLDRQRFVPLVRDFQRHSPGGLVDVSSSEIVTNLPISRYEVLPRAAGLIQLVLQGGLRIEDHRTYLIQKRISRFPSGLHGGHSVSFTLGEDVPMPLGSPGHSTVYSQETGKCIVGSRCSR